jgi:hypothetical protein
MDRDANAVQVGGSFERRRGPSILVGVVAILVLVALVKPWSFGDGSSTGGSHVPNRTIGPRAAVDGGAVPSASPGPPDLNALACLSGDTEQLVLLERWPGNEIRSWVAVADSDSIGATNAASPTTIIHSSHVIGIGICPRLSSGGSSFGSAHLLDVLAISPSTTGRISVDLGVPEPITLVTESPEWALLYGPATGAPVGGGPRAGTSASPVGTSAPVSATWAAGVYLLAFTFPLDPTEQVHWLHVEIRAGARGAG